MLVIDGSQGEGGGQILRTALGLALVTGRPLRIERIRAGRKKPGLMRQHLTAVEAAAEIGRAEVRGATLGSDRLEFVPQDVVAGDYAFDVGTAGSTTLVLQTVLPALMTADRSSRLTLTGGTHNPFAPPFDFLARCFLPLLQRLGPRITATLERPGFFPAGGGRLSVHVEPAPLARGLELVERGPLRRTTARALVANLPRHVAERELRVVQQRLGWAPADLRVEELHSASGPGNVLLLEVQSAHVTEVFSAFGERGLRAEAVAERAADEARRYLAAEVPVGPHLADQLLVPLALAGGGRFLTLPLTPHARTNIAVLTELLECAVDVEDAGAGRCLVTVRRR